MARPTRPEWAVNRGSMPAARAAAANRSLMAWAERPTTRSVGSTATRRSLSAPQGPGDVALDETGVGRLAVGVGLAAADGRMSQLL